MDGCRGYSAFMPGSGEKDLKPSAARSSLEWSLNSGPYYPICCSTASPKQIIDKCTPFVAKLRLCHSCSPITLRRTTNDARFILNSFGRPVGQRCVWAYLEDPTSLRESYEYGEQLACALTCSRCQEESFQQLYSFPGGGVALSGYSFAQCGSLLMCSKLNPFVVLDFQLQESVESALGFTFSMFMAEQTGSKIKLKYGTFHAQQLITNLCRGETRMSSSGTWCT